MNRRMNGFSPLLLCVLILPCMTAFAAAHPPVNTYYEPPNKHAYKPANKHDYKHDYKNDFKNEVPVVARRGYFEVIGAGSLSVADPRNGTINVTSSETDTLRNSNNLWDSWGGQLGVGYAYFLPDPVMDRIHWFTLLEPELNAYYSDYKSRGDVYRFGSAAYNDLHYNMSIRSTRLMLDTALTVAQWRQYSIYGIAGIGAAWNHISYRDRDNSNAPCSLFNVGVNKSKAHFVWEAGAGAVYAFNDTARLSLEYLYTDFGRLSASSNGSSINFNLHAQAVLLGLHLAAG